MASLEVAFLLRSRAFWRLAQSSADVGVLLDSAVSRWNQRVRSRRFVHLKQRGGWPARPVVVLLVHHHLLRLKRGMRNVRDFGDAR